MAQNVSSSQVVGMSELWPRDHGALSRCGTLDKSLPGMFPLLYYRHQGERSQLKALPPLTTGDQTHPWRRGQRAGPHPHWSAGATSTREWRAQGSWCPGFWEPFQKNPQPPQEPPTITSCA